MTNKNNDIFDTLTKVDWHRTTQHQAAEFGNAVSNLKEHQIKKELNIRVWFAAAVTCLLYTLLILFVSDVRDLAFIALVLFGVVLAANIFANIPDKTTQILYQNLKNKIDKLPLK